MSTHQPRAAYYLPPTHVARRWGWGGMAMLALVILALAAPLIAPQNPSDPLGFDPLAANRPPALSWTYLLGADARGRSVLALLLWGSRVALALGVEAALLAAALGLLLGVLTCWRDGLLDAPLSFAMEVCQAAPPLLVLLLLAARLGGVPAPLMLAVFALTGWVAPARLARAALLAGRRAPYIDAARAQGVGGPRLVAVHLLPAVAAPLAAWTAAGAATYVALEAGLDFLGLGLPDGTTSWGTALAGAQDALAGGNWWWMACGGAALALATLALAALAREIARALNPVTSRHEVMAPETTDEPALAPSDLWRAGPPRPAARRRPGARLVAIGMAAVLLGLAAVGAQAAHQEPRPVPSAALLLQRALNYPRLRGQAHAYIATVLFAATEEALRGESLPWAAWGPCPAGLAARRCALSTAQLWYSDGQARMQMEGSTAICTPRWSWVLNPMAGAAETTARRCGVLGPELGQLGITTGRIAALLPTPHSVEDHGRVLGADAVAGRRCWVVALSRAGRLCVDAQTGLALRLERLDRAGQPLASVTLTALSYGLDLAPELFADPIPGGRGPLVSGLTQPMLDIQVADDFALFTTLVPPAPPAGLTSQTPTFDSFYDERRGYAPQQRVRQAYVDHTGRVALVLIETLPGSAWDATPPAHPRRVSYAGVRLLVWPAAPGQPALVRREAIGTAALASSRVLPLGALERFAAGLR